MENNNILEQINASGLKLLASFSPEQLCPTVVEEAKKLVRAEHGAMFLLNQDKLILAYSSSAIASQIKIKKHGYLNQASKAHQITIMHSKDIEKQQPMLEKNGIKSIIIIPLSYRTETIGIMILYSLRDQYFTHKESNILRLYGSMASFALIKTRLHEETKNALALRDKFISLASHELRTPLTSLNGYIQLLYGKMANKNTVESRWVEELYHESIRLTNIVKEIIHINRIEQGQFAYEFTEVPIKNVIDTVLDEHKITHSDYTISLEQPTNKYYMVIGDKKRLQEMVSGLIENAIKFSEPHSHIRLSLSQTANTIQLSIENQGQGLTKKDLTSMYEVLNKTGMGQYKEGMGIGLLIAKHIANQHRGKIRISSTENKGTTLKLTLPRANI